MCLWSMGVFQFYALFAWVAGLAEGNGNRTQVRIFVYVCICARIGVGVHVYVCAKKRREEGTVRTVHYCRQRNVMSWYLHTDIPSLPPNPTNNRRHRRHRRRCRRCRSS